MTDYLYVILQIVLPPILLSIIGFLMVVAFYWLLYKITGSLLNVCWLIVSKWQDFKESTKVWREKNNTNQTI